MDFLAGILKGIIQIFGPTIGRWLLAAAKWIGKALLAVLIFIFDLLVKIGKLDGDTTFAANAFELFLNF